MRFLMDALVRMRGLEPTIVHIKSMLFYQLNYILILNLSVQVVKRLFPLCHVKVAQKIVTRHYLCTPLAGEQSAALWP